jgi:hypothetical protein
MTKQVQKMANFAAAYISGGKNTGRAFDNCFEWHGADAVAIALYRRAAKRPNTKLAANLFNYLGRESVMRVVDKYSEWRDLEALADYLKDNQTRA